MGCTSLVAMPPAGLLAHHQVLVGPRGDLRQVRDHQHLVPLRHLRERRAHLRPDLAADPLIHLVEDQRRDRVVPHEHDLEREHQPRQLAARGHPRERLGLEADVELHVELHALLPVRRRLGQRRQRDRAACRPGSPNCGSSRLTPRAEPVGGVGCAWPRARPPPPGATTPQRRAARRGRGGRRRRCRAGRARRRSGRAWPAPPRAWRRTSR